MATVYIVQDPETRNIEPARRFGQIVVILNGKETPTQAAHKLVRALDAMTEEDFLLLIGNPLFIGLACHVALTALGGQMQALVWDRKHLTYNIEKVELQ